MRGTPALCGVPETLSWRGRSCSRRARYSLPARGCYCPGGGPRGRIPSAPRGGGLGGALTSPPLPQLLQEGGSGERGSNPPQLPAATPKLGGSLLGHVLTNLASLRPSLELSRTLISLPLGVQVSLRTEASGDASTWVRAARADRTLVGDTLKIGGRQSWYFRQGFSQIFKSCEDYGAAKDFKAEHRGVSWTGEFFV